MIIITIKYENIPDVSLHVKLDEITTLIDLLEVLKLDIVDMIRIKKES